MHPSIRDLFLAHPLALILFWLPLAAVGYDFVNSPNVEDGVRIAAIILFMLWAAETLKALPKVTWYLYQKRKHAALGRDPEELRQARRRRQQVGLVTLAIMAFGFALLYLRDHSYAENHNHYFAAVVVAFSLTMLALRALYSCLPARVRTVLNTPVTGKDEPFAVTWRLPVPKKSPDVAEISATLPDYCKRLLSTRTPAPAFKQAVNS